MCPDAFPNKKRVAPQMAQGLASLTQVKPVWGCFYAHVCLGASFFFLGAVLPEVLVGARERHCVVMAIKAALPKYELYFYKAVLALALLWSTRRIFEASACEYDATRPAYRPAQLKA